jgi:hypothetical protein
MGRPWQILGRFRRSLRQRLRNPADPDGQFGRTFRWAVGADAANHQGIASPMSAGQKTLAASATNSPRCVPARCHQAEPAPCPMPARTNDQSQQCRAPSSPIAGRGGHTSHGAATRATRIPPSSRVSITNHCVLDIVGSWSGKVGRLGRNRISPVAMTVAQATAAPAAIPAPSGPPAPTATGPTAPWSCCPMDPPVWKPECLPANRQDYGF